MNGMKKIQSLNPATGELLAEFETLDLAGAQHKAQETRVAQREWRLLPMSQRATLVKQLGEVLRMNKDEYGRLMTLEMGKPLKEAVAEVEKCALLCDYYAENGPTFLAPEDVPTEAKKSYVRFDPLGVVLGVMPWNFPFWQVIRFAVPAILAGNGGLLKHSSNVPQCALALEESFAKAGFPRHLFQALLISGPDASALIGTPAVDAVSLTGSTAAGSHVAEAAGKALKPCVLELGGSDPFIILDDADVERAAQVAVAARMINNGLSCIAAKRFIIQKGAIEAFERAVAEEFKKLKMGNPVDEGVNIGPLAAQLFADEIERQVNDSLSKGAQAVFGGKKPQGPGAFFEPTLLKGVMPGMATWDEEVFGPVMSYIAVENVEEAIEIANSSEYGLGSSLWTKDLALAESVAPRIEAGFVGINSMVKSDPRLPFGGVKRSGFGRELSQFGIREFVNVKTVVVNE